MIKSKHLMRLSFAAVCWLPLILCAGAGAEEPLPQPLPPEIAAASDDAQLAIEGFAIPKGWKCELFAAEPMLANPVAFHVDAQGDVYVCESFRLKKGVEDNRDHEYWVDDELAARRVEDRRVYIKKHLGDEGVKKYTEHSERVRLLRDTDGDGRADQSSVFSTGYNDLIDGAGAGVLRHGRDVFFTCIPHLWRLRDNDGDGVAESKESLLSGFGIHFAYRGHDLHGLIVGPDRKLYFTIGDRGYHVETEGREVSGPDSGALFRCNLDGSALEVVHTGLRNPQEIAFDDFGNLFTCDNNSDRGEQSRWVYLAEGGDSGWRLAYQYASLQSPFFAENLWRADASNQAAYIVPPVGHIADGPAGLAAYPGTGLSDAYRGQFFLSDFRGSAAGSGVRAVKVEAAGAFFKMIDAGRPVWKILSTDIDFAADGSLYVADWVESWDGSGKGRVYRFFDPKEQATPLVQQTHTLLRDGLQETPTEEIKKLLGHADRRVRTAAHFELVDRDAVEVLLEAAQADEVQLARVHAIWGLRLLADKREYRPAVIGRLPSLLIDEDGEVRAQAAKLAGDAVLTEMVDGLTNRLADESLRVRFLAALALSKLSDPGIIPAIVDMLADNADADPMVRHGGIMALTKLGSEESLGALAEHPSAAVRLATTVALRKQQSPQTTKFLNDGDPRVVDEAARAIYDVPIPSELPKLAALIERRIESTVTMRRVLNANYRLGTAKHAVSLAQFAARGDASSALRLEALELLAAWESPSPRDRILGMWRPLPRRDIASAQQAVRHSLAGMLSGSEEVRRKALQVAAQLKIKEVNDVLAATFIDLPQAASARAEALAALASLEDPRVLAFAKRALVADKTELRIAGRTALVEVDPAAALSSLRLAATKGSIVEQQHAIGLLGTSGIQGSDEVLADLFENLFGDALPKEVRLDLLTAAKPSKSPEIQTLLAQYHASGANPETLWGGDATRGRDIFFGRVEVSCVRCHRVDGRGGAVGPDLSKVAAQQTREYLLQSLIAPNAAIAKGFEAVVVLTADGLIHRGIVQQPKSKSAEEEEPLRLMTAEGRIVTIARGKIDSLKQDRSAMPDDVAKTLSPLEMRDLVAFLASLK